MKFKSTLELEPASFEIKHTDKTALMGSCFTEHIGSKLKAHKFDVLQNPFGTVFHPYPICWLIQQSLTSKFIKKDTLDFKDGIYFHDQFHYSFSNPNPSTALQQMNEAISKTAQFLKSSHFLILSLGTAIGYFNKEKGRMVANCHKLPQEIFNKTHTDIDEMASTLGQMIKDIQHFNPGLQIIFTLSPVRHLKDGILENSKSKAALLMAIQTLVDQFSNLHYFPSYEIMLDDLRDYRFYEMDLVHPNVMAQAYIWEKFSNRYFSDETAGINQSIEKINQAFRHKVFHADSLKHKEFLKKSITKIESLVGHYPFLDLSEELNYFSAGLKGSAS